MKKSISITGSCLALSVGIILGLTTFPKPSIRAAQQPASHDVVVLRAFENAKIVDGSQHFIGLSVYVSSSSPGAPTFPQYPDPAAPPLSQAMAELFSQGFHLERISQGTESYIFVR